MKGQRRIFDIVVGDELLWCGELHGVLSCRVEVQCHTTLDTRNKTAKNICVSICKQYMNIKKMIVTNVRGLTARLQYLPSLFLV